jgi:hypothetical protein
MKPEINQQVMVVGAYHLDGIVSHIFHPSFLHKGRIVYIDPVTFLCKVKLDEHEELVSSVMFYSKQPEGAVSNLWQICYPMEGEKT